MTVDNLDGYENRYIRRRDGRAITLVRTLGHGDVFGVCGPEALGPLQVREMISAEILPGQYSNPWKNAATELEQQCLDFATCDPLGLSEHPDVKEAATNAISQFGLSVSIDAGLIHGHEQHRKLAARIARFYGMEHAILAGNVAVFREKLLATEKMTVTVVNPADENISEYTSFRTDDRDADAKLLLADDRRTLGLLCAKGLPAAFDEIDKARLAVVGELGNTLANGPIAFLAGPRTLIEAVQTRPNHSVNVDQLALPAAVAAITAIDCLQKADDSRKNLHQNVQSMLQLLKEAGIQGCKGIGASIDLGSNNPEVMHVLANDILSRGILSSIVSQPLDMMSLIEKSQDSRTWIRLEMSALHQPEQIVRASVAIAEAAASLGTKLQH